MAERPAPFGGRTVIADKSAWQRARLHRAADWGAAMRAGRIATCPVVMLELLYSARHRADFDDTLLELRALPFLPVERHEWETAITAMQELALTGRHRVKFPDALIAAAAHNAGVDVLHYDSHFDTLATVLRFGSCWICPRGSVS